MIWTRLLALFSLAILVTSRAQEDDYANDDNIYELTPSNFDKVVHKSNYTTIVKFYAPWCGYCQQLKPTYKKLGKYIHDTAKYAVNVASVNCEKHKALCSQHQIRGFPTLMVFRPPKHKSGKQARAQNHANEVYQGERSVKSMTKFLTSRLKNYVTKFHNVKSQGIAQWFQDEKPNVLLITDANLISPLLKSIAIDFLERVNIGVITKLNLEPHIIEVDGTDVEIPAASKSTLFYFDKNNKKLVPYDKSDKLSDKEVISQWIIDKTKVQPIEGPLSKKEKKYYSKYRTGKRKVEHDEL
ncbi:Protein disulfide-isomerase MPD1 [Candida viswanathii]|uniref:Protein disulfide-isomerase MPD1 n=1 Tax=Candida viswanathii TaxID=5486 RepID=A0A367YGX2_9ASCO|nr:Protein disulfide-isomerase MPD1 [Candida viswanathii]